MDDRNDIYIEVGFENMLESIYGTKSLRAGWKWLKYFRKELLKVARTLRRAVEKNVHGDRAHRQRILERFDHFEEYAGKLKSKDKLVQAALHLLIETQFELLGRMPRNWKPGTTGRAHHSKYQDLADYRTFYYIRTPEQRLQEIIDYAYRHCDMSEDENLFTRLIEQRHKHPHDPEKVLGWVRENEPETYGEFNTA
jgi:hypothetical protein